jgi:glutamine synthetase
MARGSGRVPLNRRHCDQVVVVSPDLQGRLFGRQVSRVAFRDSNNSVSASSGTLACDFKQSDRLVVPYTGYHTGWNDVRLVPDLGTARLAWWQPRTALVMADVVDRRSGRLVSIAPRTILKKQLRALKELDITASVGAELEFYLFCCAWDAARRNNYSGLPPITTTHSQDLLSAEIQAKAAFFTHLREKLERAGVDVASNGPEWGKGQWELSLQHTDPLALADELALSKLVTKSVAGQSGMSATFMAKPDAMDAGSSCHLHVSLNGRRGLPLFYQKATPYGMAEVMRHSIGGLLARASDLMIWYAPTINSYKRTESRDLAGYGGTWGIDNRTTMCRVVGSEKSLRVEFRLPGADVNPYLAIAGVLASIREGIELQRNPSQPVTGDAYTHHDVSALPSTLQAAINSFEQSEFSERVFGEEVVEHYSLHSRFEVSEFRKCVTDWEKLRYFETA